MPILNYGQFKAPLKMMGEIQLRMLIINTLWVQILFVSSPRPADMNKYN
jgi:hypothetical protein